MANRPQILPVLSKPVVTGYQDLIIPSSLGTSGVTTVIDNSGTRADPGRALGPCPTSPVGRSRPLRR